MGFLETNCLVFGGKDARKAMPMAEFIKERCTTIVARHTPTFQAGIAPPKLTVSRDLRLVTPDEVAQKVIRKVGIGGTTHTNIAWVVSIKESSIVVPVGAVLYLTKQLYVSEEDTRL